MDMGLAGRFKKEKRTEATTSCSGNARAGVLLHGFWKQHGSCRPFGDLRACVRCLSGKESKACMCRYTSVFVNIDLKQNGGYIVSCFHLLFHR